MKKENAAQRVERIKNEKNGLLVLKDIKRYAKTNESIDPEDIDRFKWYGLYTQNKNLQDKNDDTLYFMLRIKLFGGANIEQLECLAYISKEYGRNTAAFTTRQSLQIHFIKVTNLPDILDRLNNVGLTSIYAAGDVPRGIVTCPVDDISKSSVYDTSKLANEINEFIVGNKELVNLPRKFKIGISGCDKHCMGHEIQDVSFSAIEMKNKVLFDVNVGGGLGSNKNFAISLGLIEAKNILIVTKVITFIYRDFGLRESRKKARLGHLIQDWGIDKFKAKVQEELEFEFLEPVDINYSEYSKREHFGVHNSIIQNKSYIGCAINGGKIGADKLSLLIEILKNNGATKIKATTTQNFIILDVPNDNVRKVIEKLEHTGIDANPSNFKARTISCTGMEFCKFAISETKNQAIKVVEHLEKVFPDFNETISISLNGCPNSCAHPHIVNIGLLGCKVKNKDNIAVSGFELIVNGTLEGIKSRFGKKTGIKFEEKEACFIIENLLNQYIKSDFNKINDFLQEISNKENK